MAFADLERRGEPTPQRGNWRARLRGRQHRAAGASNAYAVMPTISAGVALSAEMT